MRLAIIAALAFSPVLAATANEFDWAYPVPLPEDEHPDNIVLRRVPGSTRAYTRTQVDNPFAPPDWFPDEHPPMPNVVSHGDKPSVIACARCHLPSGMGHPESASLAGQPEAYLQRQFEAFKAGRRTGSALANVMTRFARGISDEDAHAAAQYFASVKPQVWTHVIETDMVPKSYIGANAMRFAQPGGEMEPIGNRIIVLPQDEQRALSRDPHSGFLDYVPVGSIAKGQALVTTGGEKTVACAGCHGERLQGMGEVPGIAGRPPIYIVRQLNDIQKGTRAGEVTEQMKPVVQNLDSEDMVAIAAYLGSLAP